MKNFITILILALSFSVACAQDNKKENNNNRKEKWEKFRQERQDFYVKTMELTDEQAAQFIPLFDEMEKRKFEAGREVRHAMRQIEKNDNVTDEQYKAVADRAAALGATEAAIEKEFYAQFCQILTPRQQFLYHRCDVEFQKKTIKKRHNKGDDKKQHCNQQ